jgi:hypothetical protein
LLASVAFAVNVTVWAVASFAVKVATPELLVVAVVDVITALPVLDKVKILLATGLPLAVLRVTVMVVRALPFARTMVGLATAVDAVEL